MEFVSNRDMAVYASLRQRHITPNTTEELRFDGYRALAIKTGGRLELRSRNDEDFNAGYPGIGKALAPMSDDTIIDGEIVALDPGGRPFFNLLQNYGSAGAPLHFFVFDVLILKGEDVMSEPLMKRRQLLGKTRSAWVSVRSQKSILQ